MSKDFSFIAKSANNQTPSQTLRLLTAEVGKMNELFHKEEIYGPQGFLGDQKAEAADALSMLRMWYEHHSWTLDEMMELGEQRYLERMVDISRYAKKRYQRIVNVLRRNDE